LLLLSELLLFKVSINDANTDGDNVVGIVVDVVDVVVEEDDAEFNK
jgi:hypothetical protein